MSFVLLIAVIGILLFYNYYWKRRDLPPGPPPIPFIGNLIDIALKPPGYEAFQTWQKQYGNIYTYWISEQPIIAVNDYNLINETFIKDGDTFAGRTTTGEYHIHIRGGDYGIVSTEADLWKEHRRFALHVFRNFGMGRGLMEEKILYELEHMLDLINEQILSSSNNQKPPINLIPIFEITVANVINQMLFGFSYHEKEKQAEFSQFKNVISRHMQMGLWPSILIGLTFNSFSKYLPYIKDQMVRFRGDYDIITGYCYEQIEKRRTEMKTKEYNWESDPRDYTEAYLREAQKDESSSFTDVQLANSLFDLWIAGQETTANTLIFSILYILHNPKVQEKLHKELDAVIGSNQRITVADKNSLVYVNAFINEVQRSVNLLPQNLLHKTMKDCQIGGYFIKKGTTILPQISNVLYDEKIFPSPQKFIPERFIDANGQLKKVEELIPFSIGKRQCLGESLARMELFLLVANFYNLFMVSPIDPSNLPSLEKTSGITIQPKPFQCYISKRY